MPPPFAATLHRTPAARLAGLDGLRGIAALCVLYFHAMGTLHPALQIDGRGYLAVDFFFMLSGYIMARTYEHRFAQGFGAGIFMTVRCRKLWPFMAVGALLGIPIVGLQLDDPVATLRIAATNVFLVPAFGESALYPVNIAAWSILAELFANAIHGLILWRLPTRVLTSLCLAMVPFLCWITATYGGLGVGADAGSAHLGFARAMLPYCIGIVLWRWWRDRPTIPVSPVLAFAAMPLLVLLVPAAFSVPWVYDLAFALLACPLLIAGGLAFTGANRTLDWIGSISFPLYAINLPILLWAKGLGLGAVGGLALSLMLASYLALRTSSGPVAKPAFAAA